MQMLAKIFRKLESSVSFSYENTFTEGTNLRPVKAVHYDERLLSLAQMEFCLKSMRIVILLQPLRWRRVECVIHHERDVREEQHPYIRGTHKQ